ncbi:protein LTO1 homolog [Lineus longissimus]|uniref:protein LTO1 homolog n=1 Tax=Lineus longissimus TaxID=88925 RepID=UPI00315C4F13
MKPVFATETTEDDVFDSIVLADEKFQQEGYDEGFKDGQLQGIQEGYKLGTKHGLQLGAEVGFYHGFVIGLQKVLEGDDKLTPRKVTVLKSFRELVMAFDIVDHHNEKFSDNVGKIRAKFKQVCSLLKVNPESGHKPQGISF